MKRPDDAIRYLGNWGLYVPAFAFHGVKDLFEYQKNVLVYIEELEAENTRLKAELERIERWDAEIYRKMQRGEDA